VHLALIYRYLTSVIYCINEHIVVYYRNEIIKRKI